MLLQRVTNNQKVSYVTTKGTNNQKLVMLI